jgi:hypothetical protein
MRAKTAAETPKNAVENAGLFLTISKRQEWTLFLTTNST